MKKKLTFNYNKVGVKITLKTFYDEKVKIVTLQCNKGDKMTEKKFIERFKI